MKTPTESTTCIALVRPGSDIARQWRFLKPTFGIYEYDKAFNSHMLRWGDGSWQELTPGELDQLVLLEAHGEALVNQLFD